MNERFKSIGAEIDQTAYETALARLAS